MGKKREPFDGSKYSPWSVLDAANAYYELSAVFTSKMQRQGIQNPDMYESVASATNRILALELYMKAFMVGACMPVPMEHNLVTLFNALPERLREHCIRLYDEGDRANPGQMRIRIESAFQLTEVHGELEPSHVRVEFDPELDTLLERNKHGFVDSRYLFQSARYDQVGLYDYEYPRLALICSILCEVLERDLQNRPLTYKRSFTF
ncbi:hypothetical protein [Massilia sp. CT11-137]|jgi:hypothetical protein|uniref:hypothetical protein n=1 Tax=Massilia sp. CT11-137 TaxID=3393901 RepID=UPI0039A65602